MHLDDDLLSRFEEGLDPSYFERSPVPAELIGYGEISAIFRIRGQADVAYKRMPLFADRAAAEKYASQYHEYCGLLAEAGLDLPESETRIVEFPGRPVVLYIAQAALPLERFAHQLIHTVPQEDIEALFDRAVLEIDKVWTFNASRGPSLELALDGQLSNWVFLQEETGPRILYVDTSTPLYRKDGVEQLDPELFLESVPWFLRWIVRRLFLDDVMNRYYDQKQVFIDLAANLYKEQRPDLVRPAVEIINDRAPEGLPDLTVEEVDRYYREDKLIWGLFLAFRRIDRWLRTRLLGRRYEYILPGRIER